ncbi:MAG: hypothetical protein M3O70_09365 [Actinomycetota bacterium]|nr:hypothetical protein [Actinomycetota bacterium]
MFWWWIGNAVLLFVVLPVVVVLLNRVLAPIERIRLTVDDILKNAVTLTREIDNLPELLAKTDRTVAEVGVGATRYVKGVLQALS